MTTDEKDVLNALLRERLHCFTQKAFHTINPGEDFLPNWHIESIAWHLEQCYRGEIKRLIINLPPRNMKSICASVAFPAWVLGRDPTSKLICVSYAHDLAAKHARDTRAVMQTDWYRRLFPGTRLRRSSETELTTTRMGMRYATSVGGALTGFGGNFIIIDDPVKADEVMSEVERNRVNRFYDSALFSRLNNKNEDVIILIMQRLHVDDLVGHVLEKEAWDILEIPAIAEQEETYEIGPDEVYIREPGEELHDAREDRAVLDTIRRQLGTATFEAQYQQRPAPPSGNLIKAAWLQTYDRQLPLAEYDQVVQSWDTASSVRATSDYSVGITVGLTNNTAHILDVVRVRLEYPELRRRVLREAARYRADQVLIEPSSSGIALLQDLRREGQLQPISLRATGDKIVRLETHSAKLEAGYVLIPERAPWLSDFKAELLAFPSSRHDDQVDALSQFLEWFSRQRRTARVRAEREEGARRNIRRREMPRRQDMRRRP